MQANVIKTDNNRQLGAHYICTGYNNTVDDDSGAESSHRTTQQKHFLNHLERLDETHEWNEGKENEKRSFEF